MSGLIEKDLELISKKIKLPLNKTKLLFEEETDQGLVLEQIADKFSATELNKFSLSTQIKILVYKHPSLKGYDISEKAFVLNGLDKLLDKKTEPKLSIQYNSNADIARKNLFWGCILKLPVTSQHILTIEKGFSNAGQRTCVLHVPQWIRVLSEIGTLLGKPV